MLTLSLLRNTCHGNGKLALHDELLMQRQVVVVAASLHSDFLPRGNGHHQGLAFVFGC